MGRMWRGGYRRFHPIGDRMGNEIVDAFDVGQPICDLDMKYGVYKVPAKEVIPYRIYPVLSPVWKAERGSGRRLGVALVIGMGKCRQITRHGEDHILRIE